MQPPVGCHVGYRGGELFVRGEGSRESEIEPETSHGRTSLLRVQDMLSRGRMVLLITAVFRAGADRGGINRGRGASWEGSHFSERRRDSAGPRDQPSCISGSGGALDRLTHSSLQRKT